MYRQRGTLAVLVSRIPWLKSADDSSVLGNATAKFCWHDQLGFENDASTVAAGVTTSGADPVSSVTLLYEGNTHPLNTGGLSYAGNRSRLDAATAVQWHQYERILRVLKPYDPNASMMALVTTP